MNRRDDPFAKAVREVFGEFTPDSKISRLEELIRVSSSDRLVYSEPPKAKPH